MNKKNQPLDMQRGNALIYVLIAIALFAALGFTLSRHTQNSDTSEIDEARADIYATQIISYATQAKSVIDQMIFTGSSITELDFTLPSEAGFNTPPYIHKVFHPQGGGLTLGKIPADAVPSGYTGEWTLDNANNVEWSKTASNDVVLAAFVINKTVCEKINEKISQNPTTPLLAANFTAVFNTHTVDLTTTNCPDCEGYMSLCVQRSGSAKPFAFYSILADH